MAESMKKSELKHTAVDPYAKIRDRIRSADLLFASGDYQVSKLIRHFTKSIWSHVGILFRVPHLDRILLLESVEPVGVRFAPLSRYLDDYKGGRPYLGQIMIARDAQISTGVVKDIAQFGIGELTRDYDRDEILKIVGRIVLNRGRRSRDREYICSELVYECFKKAGREYEYDPRGFISPENVWSTPEIKPQWRVL